MRYNKKAGRADRQIGSSSDSRNTERPQVVRHRFNLFIVAVSDAIKVLNLG